MRYLANDASNGSQMDTADVTFEIHRDHDGFRAFNFPHDAGAQFPY